MKKKIAAIAAAGMIFAITGCGEKKNIEKPEIEDTQVKTTEAVTEIATEAVSVTATETAEKNTGKTTEKPTAPSETTTAVASEGTANGIFDSPENSVSENDILAAAQELFEAACRTEWEYTVGSPYDLDTGSFVTNKLGWEFYLVTTEGINSMDDVKAGYHKVFSENYKDALGDLYIEENGRVYCLSGARGSDIFYISSEISEIKSRSENEIVFNVVDSYGGDDFGNEPYSENNDFAIERDESGNWKVSVFHLPY